MTPRTAQTSRAPHPALYTTALRYSGRDDKAAYIADKYHAILTGRILDVGCDQRQLRSHIPACASYTGIDLAPPADITLDLDANPLPFPDRAFDTVVCCDVLEHLEHIHTVADELFRVAASRVIISLPNPIKALLQSLYEGARDGLKWYGLPLEPQKDRHRWFFGFEDAVRFTTDRAARHGFTAEQIDASSTEGYYWTNGAGFDVLEHPNTRMGNMWAVLRREGPAR